MTVMSSNSEVQLERSGNRCPELMSPVQTLVNRLEELEASEGLSVSTREATHHVDDSDEVGFRHV